MIASTVKFLYYTLLLSLVFLFPSCSTSKIVVDKESMAVVETVAIMKFNAAPGIPEAVVIECQEAFRGHFIEAGKKVVERGRMKELTEEMERSYSGVVKHSKEIGNLLGADALLMGEVTRYDRVIRWVEYYEYEDDLFSKKKRKVKKYKRRKFFSFQLQIRLIETATGNTILTMKNKYPEGNYDLSSSFSLAMFREMKLEGMGRDLIKALKEE